ncbi:hypothetical protein [Granulicella sp. S156]|jgi:hypothetical protein|uniref:hypothetical protein n=1 Tax=Granulicella sp. S156 TaxID=1747224 RepID=UPI00131E7912|nr:hypothetical protein [Granulicella sp. S156]
MEHDQRIKEFFASLDAHAQFRAVHAAAPLSSTRGHGTHTLAAIWKDYLVELLAESEPKH